VDAYQVSVYRLTLGAAVCAAGALLGGCGGGKGAKAPNVSKIAQREAKAMQRDVSSITAEASNNDFAVDDAEGRPILKAKTAKVDGSFKPGQGLQGPMRLREVKALLYQKGKPQMNLEAPEATWDGKLLATDKPSHAVTVDGKTVIDAQKAVWTAQTGHLQLQTAKLQSMKEGKVDFTADAPKAMVEKQVATMPTGAVARNPLGQELSANHMRWNMATGKLEARGNVVVRTEGTQVYGERLSSDTKLKRGRLSGGTRVRMQKSPVVAKNG